MEILNTALQGLREELCRKNEMAAVADSFHSLAFISDVVKTPSTPKDSYQKLSFILRRRMIKLYRIVLIHALQYAGAVLEITLDLKTPGDAETRNFWDDVQESLLSGILDFLEQHSTTEKQTLVASVLYPLLCREFFPREHGPVVNAQDNLLCTVFQVLSETVISHPTNQHKLRDSCVLGGSRLGMMLAQCRDFLVIEALLELFGNIIPSAKRPEKRAGFIEDVFSSARFKCSVEITQMLERVTSTGWDTASSTIFEALAKSSIAYPQPFETSQVRIGEASYTVSRIYVDKNAFVASVDDGGQLETFKLPFHTVQHVQVSSPSAYMVTVVVIVTTPPLLGHTFAIEKRGEISVAFDLKKENIGVFVAAVRQRGLGSVLVPFYKKQSMAETHVNLAFQSTKAKTPPFEEKLENLARLWKLQRSPDDAEQNATTSPLHNVLKVNETAVEEDIEFGPSTTQLACTKERVPPGLSIDKQSAQEVPQCNSTLGQSDEPCAIEEPLPRDACAAPRLNIQSKKKVLKSRMTGRPRTVRLSKKARAIGDENSVSITQADAANVVALGSQLKPKARRRKIPRNRVLSAGTDVDLNDSKSIITSDAVSIATAKENVDRDSSFGQSSPPFNGEVSKQRFQASAAVSPVSPKWHSPEVLEGVLAATETTNENGRDSKDNIESQYKRHTNMLPTDYSPPEKHIDYADNVIETEPLIGDGDSTMAVGRKSGNEQGGNAEQVQNDGARTKKAGELTPVLIDLTDDGLAGARMTSKLFPMASSIEIQLEAPEDAGTKAPVSKAFGDGSNPLDKAHIASKQAEEGYNSMGRFASERFEKGTLGQSGRIRDQGVRMQFRGDVETKQRPSVAFILPAGSNVKDRTERKVHLHDNSNARLKQSQIDICLQARGREQEYYSRKPPSRVANRVMSSERQRFSRTDAVKGIIQVVDQIHEVIVEKVVEKFEEIREDVHITQANILESTKGDLLLMQTKSMQHYEQLVDLANEYATHGRKLIRSLGQSLDTETDLVKGVRDIIHQHDRISLSSWLPSIVSPAIPESFSNGQE